MKENVALIAGSSGAVGNALARELSSKKEWKVYVCQEMLHKFINVMYLNQMIYT